VRDEELLEARGTVVGLEAELHRVRNEGSRLARKVEETKEQMVVLEAARAALEAERDRLETARGEFEVEVARLNGLLETIYGSRTWKLHEFIESLRGRSQSK
jgi:chromosome segregation ATPase